jgi:TLD
MAMLLFFISTFVLIFIFIVSILILIIITFVVLRIFFCLNFSITIILISYFLFPTTCLITQDGDLDKGSSGECETFMSPCLSSSEEFVCSDCELFGFETSML